MSKLFLDQSSEEINTHETDLGKKQFTHETDLVSKQGSQKKMFLSYISLVCKLFPSKISLIRNTLHIRLISCGTLTDTDQIQKQKQSVCRHPN